MLNRAPEYLKRVKRKFLQYKCLMQAVCEEHGSKPYISIFLVSYGRHALQLKPANQKRNSMELDPKMHQGPAPGFYDV